MNFIILHGTLGNPEHNWYPWLAAELENRDHRTIRPQLPTPEGQNLNSWIHTINNTVNQLRIKKDDLIFVAHSMSPLAVCHYLTTIAAPVRACFFVAPFAERLPDTPDPYPALNNPFVDAKINWSEVKGKSKQFICFASDDDPYVPTAVTKNFAEHLSAELVLVPTAGHFNTSSGYREFPLLLKTIEDVLKKDSHS